MSERGIPKGARKLEELLAEREQWKAEVRNVFYMARSSAGMNQAQFADALGTSQSYVSEIESGTKTPSSETLFKLHSFMGGTSDATTQAWGGDSYTFTVSGQEDGEQATATDTSREHNPT